MDTQKHAVTEVAAALAAAQSATAEAERLHREQLAKLAPLRDDHQRSLVR